MQVLKKQTIHCSSYLDGALQREWVETRNVYKRNPPKYRQGARVLPPEADGFEYHISHLSDKYGKRIRPNPDGTWYVVWNIMTLQKSQMPDFSVKVSAYADS